MSHHKFYLGDVLDVLKGLPDNFVQCCVTSPPYWGLRDYGVAWQLGLEKTPEEYVAKIVEVFREVRRVLRDDGTLWLNLGDTYAAGGLGHGSGKQATNYGSYNGSHIEKPCKAPEDFKPKDLLGIPWMIAFALRTDGWYLRSDIIWEKPNAMPESVADRPTKSHEYLFLLSKLEKYYYDIDAIREPHQQASIERAKRPWKGDGSRGYPGQPQLRKRDEAMNTCHPNGRNKRTVWTVATQPFPGAHFATFPPKLIEPCILAGTSPQACPNCGAPWKREVKKTGHQNKREDAHVPNNTPSKTDSTGWAPTATGTDKFTPTCSCPGNDGSGRSVVLDPFGGAGTTSLVAMMHNRNSIYIDLNEKYLNMALKRLGFKESKLIDYYTYEVIK